MTDSESTTDMTVFESDVVYLCGIPRMFRGGTESPYQLVHKSRTSPVELTVDAVKAVLDGDLQLIEDWQRWSEDKRSAGWYLDSRGGSHVVGYVPTGERLVFGDAVSACATFIVRELRAIW